MKTSRFTEEQIVKILREAETGEQSITSICRTHDIAENTYYTWRKKYGGVDVAAIKRLRDVEQENTRLTRLLAERDLELEVIRRCSQKNDGRAVTTRDGPTISCAWPVPPSQVRALLQQPRQCAVSPTPRASHAEPAAR